MNAQRRTSIRRGNKATAPDPTPTASDEHPTQIFSAYRDEPEDATDATGETRGTDAGVVDEWEMALRGDESSAPAPVARERVTKGLRRGIARQKQRSSAPETEQVTDFEPDTITEPDTTTEPAAPRASSSDERPTQVFSAIRDDTPAPEPEDDPGEVRAATVTEEPAEKKAPSPTRRTAAVEASPEPDVKPAVTNFAAPEKPEAVSPLASQLFGDYPGRDERVETTVMPRITDDGWPADGDWDSPGGRADEPATAAAPVVPAAEEADEAEDAAQAVAPDERDDLEDTAQHNAFLDFDDEDDEEVDEHGVLFAGRDAATPEAPAASAEDAAEDQPEQPSVVGHWDPKQWAAARTEADEQDKDVTRSDDEERDEHGGAPDGAETQQTQHEEQDENAPSAPAETAEERTQLIPAFRDDEASDDGHDEREDATGEQARVRVDDDEAPGERTELIPAYPMGRFDEETAAERTEFIPTYTPDGAAIITEPGGKPQPVASALDAVRDTKAKKSSQAATRRPVALVAVLLLVGLLGGGAAYLMQDKAAVAARTTPSSNLALIDMVATAQVKGDVTKAVQTIYSYDSNTLDQSEPKALSLITGDYANEFKQTYAAVRKLGQRMHVSLASTVAEAGVETLTERRATLLMMVNQIGRQGDNGQPLKAQVRLSVTVQKVGGQWKVSDVKSR